MGSILTLNQSNQPSGHLTRVYNAQEWNVIDLFKTQYSEATSLAARKTIAWVHIFPTLFNYWSSIGEVFDDERMNLRATVS